MEGEQGATGGKTSPTLSESPPSTPVNGVSDQESQDVKVRCCICSAHRKEALFCNGMCIACS
jgi:hypothetical protein